MMKFLKNIKKWIKLNVLRKRLILLENLSETYYTYPVTSIIVNDIGKLAWYSANGMIFGFNELSKNKKVLLIDRKTEEIRIANLVAGGDFTGPVFDKHETLITHDILAVEL